MATKNGNLMAFKTAKMKEPPKATTTATTTPPSAAVAAAAANAGSAISNGGGKLPTRPLTTYATTPPGVAWPGALPSFLPPRDLTLGGKAPPKKVFTPNLAVKRNKNLNVKTSKDTTAKRGGGAGRGGRGANNARGGGRGGKTSTLVQTKGVFSEGAGDFSIRKTASQGRYGGSGGGGGDGETPTSASLVRPIINKDDYKKIDIKADEKKLFEITGDSDDEEKFDDKTDAGDEDLPIRLNEVERRAKLLKLKASKFENVALKTEIKSENEAGDAIAAGVDIDDATALATAQKLQKLHVQEMLDAQMEPAAHQAFPRYPKSVSQFLETNEAASLFVLQLPQTLPCETDDDSKDFFYKKETKPTPMELDAPATSSLASKRLKDKPDYDLRTMQEGQIGKILRYKSGKVRLLLSKTYFDLDVALEPGFMQDIVSIRPKDEYEQDAAAIVNLGPISAKITATPPWEEFLPHTEQESKAEAAATGAAAALEQHKLPQQLA